MSSIGVDGLACIDCKRIAIPFADLVLCSRLPSQGTYENGHEAPSHESSDSGARRSG